MSNNQKPITNEADLNGNKCCNKDEEGKEEKEPNKNNNNKTIENCSTELVENEQPPSAMDSVFLNSHLVLLLISCIATSEPETEDDNLTSLQPLSQLALLREVNHFWKRCADHYIRRRLKALTIEVDFITDAKREREKMELGLLRRQPFLTFHEAVNVGGGSLADDFAVITGTLESRRRPTTVYKVLRGGPLLRLVGGQKLAAFFRFVERITTTTFAEKVEVEVDDNGDGGHQGAPLRPPPPTFLPMALEALSLVILERDGPSALVSVPYLPTIFALLDHFPHLKTLFININVVRFKCWQALNHLSRCLTRYLVESRLDSPLTSLDLDFNDMFFNDRKDFTVLAPLMPQLVHFGLNAEVVTGCLPVLLAAATAKLTSLKLNTTNFRVKHFLSAEGDGTEVLLNQAVLGRSVTSLTLVNNTKSESGEADSIAVRAFLLRHFTALTSLVLAEKDDTWDYQSGPASTFSQAHFGMLAHLHSLTRLTLIGFSLSDHHHHHRHQLPINPLEHLTELTVVGNVHFLDRFFSSTVVVLVNDDDDGGDNEGDDDDNDDDDDDDDEGNHGGSFTSAPIRLQLDVPRLARALTTEPMGILHRLTSITLYGIFSDRLQAEATRGAEAQLRELLAPRNLRRLQLHLKSAAAAAAAAPN